MKYNLFKFVKSLIKISKGKPNIPEELKNNEMLKIIYRRRSVRKFEDIEIPEYILSAILEAGRLAPSTVNLQPWTFAVMNKNE
jgi:hypothetical protein